MKLTLAAPALWLALHPMTGLAESSLPVLSDASSSIISPEQEHRLGRNWARMLRGQAKLLPDPLVKQYLADLLWQIAPHSDLSDLRLELIVLDNPTFNAFAVPGGVVGVHGGLVVASETEAELASVIAHELAHLSQRHYAQQLEESRRNRPLFLAGILASILVASVDGQAGTAALTSTLGASASSQLAFSRRNEQEADRIGMQTLVGSGYDPYAMPQMFSRLQRSYRFYGQKPPEFLLTHPVTESRIADSLNRASNLPRPHALHTGLEYDLIRTRLQVHYADDLQRRYQQFLDDAKSSGRAADRYGALVAAIRLNKLEQARQQLTALPKAWRNHLYVQLTEVELLLAEQRTSDAYTLAKKLLALYPDSMPVRYRLALAARQAGDYTRAAATFRALCSDYPDDSDFWFQLAESEGLNDNIIGVHFARIEYFLLIGQMDLAQRQLEFARRERSLNSVDRARIEQKEKEIKQLQKEMKEDLS